MSTPAFTPDAEPPRARRPLRRGIALLPSLLTVANLGAGWYAIQETVAALQNPTPAPLLNNASLAVGWSILLDGFDGRIARMANATSAFGRELDSLADIISFGAAPALLAYVWGIRFLELTPHALRHLDHAAQIVVFLFVIAGAARLARFNISTHESKPSNPGKPGKRYFVGMPIPAAAGVIAAIIHFFTSPNFPGIAETNASWIAALVWLALIVVLSYFMVSTWRFYSFKDIDLGRRHPFVITLLVAALIAGIWQFSEVLLLLVALAYTGAAVFWRVSHYLRRRHA